MELLVLGWLILEVTDSPFQLGLVLVFNNLPRPIVSFFTGFIADRFSRHRMLLVSQTTNAITSAVLLTLFVVASIDPWHVFIAISVLGITKALDDPSRRTAILDIAGQGRVVNAMSLDVVSNTTGKMAGPILGGILIATVDFTGAFLFLLVVHVVNLWLLLARVRIPDFQRYRQVEPMWRSMGVAIRYALHSPTLLAMLYVTIVMNATGFPVRQFIPAIGRDHLHVGAVLVGLLVASDGFGQLLGAGMPALTRNLRYLGRVYVLGSVVALLAAMMFAWAPWYGLAVVLLAVGGIGQAGFSTMHSTITMLSAPEGMRGRMMGLQSVCVGVGTPLGTLEMGAIATFSTQWAISGNALVGLILLLPALFLMPLARRPIVQVEPVATAGGNPSAHLPG